MVPDTFIRWGPVVKVQGLGAGHYRCVEMRFHGGGAPFHLSHHFRVHSDHAAEDKDSACTKMDPW